MLRHLLFRLAVLPVLFAAPVAAEHHWENGCDAGLYYEDCKTLMLFYEHGVQIFPEDSDRVQSLRLSVRGAAREFCLAGEASTCADVIDTIMNDAEYTSEDKLRDARAIFQFFEDQCHAGDALICEQRVYLSYASPVLRLRDGIEAAQGSERWRTLFGDTDAWHEVYSAALRQEEAKAQSGCAQGDQAACLKAARLHVRTVAGGDLDLSITAPLEEECLSGNRFVCGEFEATAYMMRKTAPEMFGATTARISNACSVGNVDACQSLSHFIKDDEQRRPVFLASCDAGNGGGCVAEGLTRYSEWEKAGASDADRLQNAVDYLTRGCEFGAPMACHFLEHLSKG